MDNPYLDLWRKQMGLEDDELFKEWVGCSWIKRLEIEQKIGEVEIYPGGPKLPRIHSGFMAMTGPYSMIFWTASSVGIDQENRLTNFSRALGAGTGYWAWCIRQLGGSVIALDAQPKGNHYCDGYSWTEVLEGQPEALRRYRSQYSLFLSWPSYATPFAYQSLQSFRGNILIYVGEGHGGCTGCDDFHELLEMEWTLIDEMDIPQYSGIHDRMFIYQRNKPRSRHWTYYKRWKK